MEEQRQQAQEALLAGRQILHGTGYSALIDDQKTLTYARKRLPVAGAL